MSEAREAKGKAVETDGDNGKNEDGNPLASLSGGGNDLTSATRWKAFAKTSDLWGLSDELLDIVPDSDLALLGLVLRRDRPFDGARCHSRVGVGGRRGEALGLEGFNPLIAGRGDDAYGRTRRLGEGVGDVFKSRTVGSFDRDDANIVESGGQSTCGDVTEILWCHHRQPEIGGEHRMQLAGLADLIELHPEIRKVVGAPVDGRRDLLRGQSFLEGIENAGIPGTRIERLAGDGAHGRGGDDLLQP